MGTDQLGPRHLQPHPLRRAHLGRHRLSARAHRRRWSRCLSARFPATSAAGSIRSTQRFVDVFLVDPGDHPADLRDQRVRRARRAVYADVLDHPHRRLPDRRGRRCASSAGARSRRRTTSTSTPRARSARRTARIVIQPHHPERAAGCDRAGDGQRRHRDPRRGNDQLPRLRHPAAVPVVGRHAEHHAARRSSARTRCRRCGRGWRSR